MNKALNLLFEIGFWGLPYNICERSITEMKKLLDEFLINEGLSFKKSYIILNKFRYSTFIEGLIVPAETFLEIKGPLARQAFDINGLPTQAAIGFANSQGVNIKDLIIKKVNDEEYIFARKKIGLENRDILANKFYNFFLQLPKWKCKPYRSNSVLPQTISYFCMLIDDYLPKLSLDTKLCEPSIFIYSDNKFSKVTLEKADDFLQYINPKVINDESTQQEIIDKINLELHSFELYDNLVVNKKNIEVNYINFFFNKPQPYVIKLPEILFSNLPSELIARIIEHFKLLLPIHDKNGNLSKYAVGIKNYKKPKEVEIKLFELQIETFAEKILKIWHKDLEMSFSEMLAKLKKSESLNCVESWYDFLLRVKRRCIKLLEILKLDYSENLIEKTIFNFGGGWILELTKVFPDFAYKLPALLSQSKTTTESNQAMSEILNDLAKSYENLNPLPKSDLACVILLSIYFNLSHDKQKGDKYRYLVLKLLYNKKLYIDIFKVFTLNEDTLEFVPELWRESLIKFIYELDININQKNVFLNLPFFIPLTIIECVKKWQNNLPQEFEKIKSIIWKMYNFINDIDTNVNSHNIVKEDNNIINNMYFLLEKLGNVHRYNIVEFVEVFVEFIPFIEDELEEYSNNKKYLFDLYKIIKKCLDIIKNHCIYELIENQINDI